MEMKFMNKGSLTPREPLPFPKKGGEGKILQGNHCKNWQRLNSTFPSGRGVECAHCFPCDDEKGTGPGSSACKVWDYVSFLCNLYSPAPEPTEARSKGCHYSQT